MVVAALGGNRRLCWQLLLRAVVDTVAPNGLSPRPGPW